MSRAVAKLISAILVAVIVGLSLVVAGLLLSRLNQGQPSPSASPTVTPSPTQITPLSSPSTMPQPSNLPVPVVTAANNWAGYVVASDLQNPQPTVIGVSGSWTVPTVTDVGVDAFSAVWIGIGGQFDQTLIQTGTEQDFVGGVAQYSAWYEMLPADSIIIDAINVSPGDQMNASIYLAEAASNLWSISIEDLTTGQKYQNNFVYASGELSAEWIIERPQVNNVLTELADFGNVTLANCQVTFSDTKGAIYDFPSSEVIMDAQLRRGQMLQLVDVSELTNKGTQFTVSYVA